LGLSRAFASLGLRPTRQRRGLCGVGKDNDSSVLRSSSYGERHLIPSTAIILRTGKRQRIITRDHGLAACRVRDSVKVIDPTGVETEALTPVSVWYLAVRDMIKAVQRAVRIALSWLNAGPFTAD
jgi:MoaC family